MRQTHKTHKRKTTHQTSGRESFRRLLSFVVLLLVAFSLVTPLCAMPVATQTTYHASGMGRGNMDAGNMEMACASCCQSPAALQHPMACKTTHAHPAELIETLTSNHASTTVTLIAQTSDPVLAPFSIPSATASSPPRPRPANLTVLRI